MFNLNLEEEINLLKEKKKNLLLKDKEKYSHNSKQKDDNIESKPKHPFLSKKFDETKKIDVKTENFQNKLAPTKTSNLRGFQNRFNKNENNSYYMRKYRKQSVPKNKENNSTISRNKLQLFLNKKLTKKYVLNTNKLYNIKKINELIFNLPSHFTAIFKEYLIDDDDAEFIKKNYSFSEIYKHLPKIFYFYENFSIIFPNYISIPEGCFMNNNILKKQKMIDKLQKIKEDENNNNKNQLNNSNDTIFTTNAMDSIYSNNKIDFRYNNKELNEIIYLDDSNNDDEVINTINIINSIEKFEKKNDESESPKSIENKNRKKNFGLKKQNIYMKDIKNLNFNGPLTLNSKTNRDSDNSYLKKKKSTSKSRNSTVKNILKSKINHSSIIPKKNTFMNNRKNKSVLSGIASIKYHNSIDIHNYSNSVRSNSRRNYRGLSSNKKIKTINFINERRSIRNKYLRQRQKHLSLFNNSRNRLSQEGKHYYNINITNYNTMKLTVILGRGTSTNKQTATKRNYQTKNNISIESDKKQFKLVSKVQPRETIYKKIIPRLLQEENNNNFNKEKDDSSTLNTIQNQSQRNKSVNKNNLSSKKTIMLYKKKICENNQPNIFNRKKQKDISNRDLEKNSPEKEIEKNNNTIGVTDNSINNKINKNEENSQCKYLKISLLDNRNSVNSIDNNKDNCQTSKKENDNSENKKRLGARSYYKNKKKKNLENSDENIIVNYNTMNNSKESEKPKEKEKEKEKTILNKKLESDSLKPISEFDNKGKNNNTEKMVKQNEDYKHRYAKFNLKNFKNFTLRTPKDYHKRESNKSLK